MVVVMDSYYPTSRATTYIMEQILDRFSKHFEIYVFVLDLLKIDDNGKKPDEHNGIHIRYADSDVYYKSPRSLPVKLKSKLLMAFYRAKYGVKYQYDLLYLYAKQIKKLAKEINATKIISVASPTDIHICTDMSLTGMHSIEWFAFSFDPHAYNANYSEDFRKKLKREEIKLYKKAERIFMLRQSESDYRESCLSDRIIFFDIPMFKDHYPTDKTRIKKPEENNAVKIVYVGTLYRSIRNPDYMFNLFSKLSDLNFVLYIIGWFSGWGEKLNSYEQELSDTFGNKICIIDRVSRDEVKDYLYDADFLINLGNTTENQCPSKVMDYILTGKPIIHFRKTENCSSMLYFEKYNNLCVIDEKDGESHNLMKIRHFLSANRGTAIDREEILDLYAQNDIEYISSKLLSFLVK